MSNEEQQSKTEDHGHSQPKSTGDGENPGPALFRILKANLLRHVWLVRFVPFGYLSSIVAARSFAPGRLSCVRHDSLLFLACMSKAHISYVEPGGRFDQWHSHVMLRHR